ncbi:SOS response-associated peptidase [Aeromicrobium sp. CTD01-1L150]|uniref:SOS response-associated peptidase n=1 Tax=Aeromicrobium sp. CTD01-1L150 TaxID=3341830 RepID=UPI0035C26311
MCGRYASTRTPADLEADFNLRLADSTARLEADYNVAPTDVAPLVIGRSSPDAPSAVQRELLGATWGLVPSWAKDRSIGSKMINARSETVADKPAFRKAFARRRGLVPADGFYEWYAGPDHAPKQPKQPFFITAVDRSVLMLAGLYEFWRASADDEWLVTFTILTTSAEDAEGRLHDRAPLLVHPEAFDAWLEPAPRDGAELWEMVTPATPGPLEAYPVGRAVGNVANNGPELIEPIPLSE